MHNCLKTKVLLVLLLVSCNFKKKPESIGGNPTVDLSVAVNYNTQTLSIDPTDIPESLMAPVTITQERENLASEFEENFIAGKINISNFLAYAPVLFYYRDRRIAVLYRQIVSDTSIHLFLRLLSVFSLGECGNRKDFEFLYNQFKHPNPVYREYVASALVKLNDSTNQRKIQTLLVNEKNAYVCKTLMAKRKEQKWISKVLPVFDTAAVRREMFYPSSRLSGNFNRFAYDEIDSRYFTPIAGDCVYPHQQYKQNRLLYDILNYPVINFGYEDNWGRHVGEDSGWLFSGMPVHSIMDGVVVKIQHESTWGCLVVIQSKLIDSSFVTTYYGHLSSQLNVLVGDRVYMGDKIGEIALSFTLANGGYLSHLHLGIEKASFESALIKGWFDITENWYSPVAFIANYGKRDLNQFLRRMGRLNR